MALLKHTGLFSAPYGTFQTMKGTATFSVEVVDVESSSTFDHVLHCFRG